jgi:hypothetical protein
MPAGQHRFKSRTLKINPRQTFVSLGIVFLIWLTVVLVSGQTHAQGYAYEPPKFEAGPLFTGLRLDTMGEAAAGLGGRFTYNRFEHLAFEAEAGHFPENPSGNFGETEALFGVKAGTRFDQLGIFAKLRPGFIYFGGGDAAERMSDRLHFACDLGVVFEYYPSSRSMLRADFDDTIIPFGGTRFISPVGTPAGPRIVRLGTTHNFQTSLAFAFRF